MEHSKYTSSPSLIKSALRLGPRRKVAIGATVNGHFQVPRNKQTNGTMIKHCFQMGWQQRQKNGALPYTECRDGGSLRRRWRRVADSLPGMLMSCHGLPGWNSLLERWSWRCRHPKSNYTSQRTVNNWCSITTWLFKHGNANAEMDAFVSEWVSSLRLLLFETRWFPLSFLSLLYFLFSNLI